MMATMVRQLGGTLTFEDKKKPLASDVAGNMWADRPSRLWLLGDDPT